MRIKKDRCYGWIEHGVIGINLALLWRDSRNTDEFARNFAKTHAHEILHIQIAKNTQIKNLKAEEAVVRQLLSEEWDNRLAQQY